MPRCILAGTRALCDCAGDVSVTGRSDCDTTSSFIITRLDCVIHGRRAHSLRPFCKPQQFGHGPHDPFASAGATRL